MTGFSLRLLRHLRRQHARSIRWRVMQRVHYTAPPRRHHQAEHALTRRMRY
jgi:hypothetical protein